MHKVLASALLLCSFSVSADYKNFAWSISDKQGNRVYDTNNVIKAAIEQDSFIPLTYNAEFESAAADLFRQVDTLGQFELNAFASPA
ncbi:hypothetical protein JCM19238_5234 [Vibrio ponticus]|nr:hypothetical protein JCM19238_5234 [Vibrio ponticus]